MTTDDTARYLIDTNILLHLVRGGKSTPLIEELESRFAFFTGRNRVFISYVTLGEIRVLAEKFVPAVETAFVPAIEIAD